jgi:acetyltransferase-like isoleucine patch superfamily enzyme
MPKWWSKIELFNSANFDTTRVFYTDLDTVIVDNIDDILRGSGSEFVALRDFYHMFTLQTGIMTWTNGKFDHVYQRFIPRMHYFASPEIGDHVWIGENASKNPQFFQDIYGNQIVSYKKDCKNGKLPTNAKIVCFHGNPRPHTVKDKFVSDNWVY